MTPKIPRVVIKSLWQFIQEDGSSGAVREWLAKNQGLDGNTADFMYGKMKAAKSVDELEAFINGDEDEPTKLSAQEMQMMAGGRRAVAAASTSAASKSKWPWQ
jgi:hypothetical protein